VHTLPCAAILRHAFPDARIRWLINTEWLPLLDQNPNVDEAVEFPRRELRGAVGTPPDCAVGALVT
jgi:ADP-heptose:LPS heptosyltransferase